MDNMVLPPLAVKKHIFRKYDIRGFAGSEVNPELACMLGKAFATFVKGPWLKHPLIALGRDNRLSSDGLQASLCHGLQESGCNVIDIGLAPSPVLNFAVAEWNLDGGINVTASHNTAEQNGFKLVTRDAYPVAEEDMQCLLDLITNNSFVKDKGYVILKDSKEDYLKKICSLIDLERPLKVVIDAGNGVTGAIAPQLMRLLGCEVEELHCESDGRFPNHAPNPEDPENMRALQAKVIECKADMGFAYDGDGDRLGVVDERGKCYDADHIMMLLTRDHLIRYPGASILIDVKSSQLLADDISAHGGKPIFWKTGHSLIKRKMHVGGFLLAGEYSGHFFMAEDYHPIDDAMLASCRLASYLSRSSLTLSQLLGRVPQRFSTGSIELPCPDHAKYRIVDEITSYFTGQYPVLDIDGARISFADGWTLVRASNTSASITVRFEAVSSPGLRHMIKIVYDRLRRYPEVRSSSLRI